MIPSHRQYDRRGRTVVMPTQQRLWPKDIDCCHCYQNNSRLRSIMTFLSSSPSSNPPQRRLCKIALHFLLLVPFWTAIAKSPASSCAFGISRRYVRRPPWKDNTKNWFLWSMGWSPQHSWTSCNTYNEFRLSMTSSFDTNDSNNRGQSTTSNSVSTTSSSTSSWSSPRGRSYPRTWRQQPSSSGSSNSSSSKPPSLTQPYKAAIDRIRDKAGGSNRPSRGSKVRPLPVTGYDSEAILEYYDRRPLQVGWRLNRLGIPLLGWYLMLLLDRAMQMDDRADVQRQRGEQLRMLLVQSGSVALIKSGQALSLRPDIIRNPFWADELGKLVDAVGSFPDMEAMNIMKKEFIDLEPRMQLMKSYWEPIAKKRIEDVKKQKGRTLNSIQKMVESDCILSLFEFDNENRAVASASIGQVYKARIRKGPQLESAIGAKEAQIWGGKVVAIKVQRPDVEESASLDMYLLRRTATWLSKIREGDLPKVADAFGVQLFGELDYVREANNCERFRELYGGWDDVVVPAACTALTRRRVLVMEWVDGEKGPWKGQNGIDMVRIGLRCSVDQLMTTGCFHGDPHRGNLLKTPDDKLAIIDFGNVVDVDEDSRYSLFGLVIGMQNKDLRLITENLLKLGFLKDTTQLDQLIPRLRQALLNATGGTGKASNMNFAQLQAELDEISRENVLRFSTPPFFTIIVRSLTILEGVALSVDKNFRIVRGAYPYVLRQLLAPDDNQARTPPALQKLLLRVLTINGEGKEIHWERLRDFLGLAQRASKAYDPSIQEMDDKSRLSRQTITLFGQFLTSRTGLFLKKPLVHELAELIDGMASMSESRLSRLSRGFIPLLPGMSGPINERRMIEVTRMLDTMRDAIMTRTTSSSSNTTTTTAATTNGQQQEQQQPSKYTTPELVAMMEILREVSNFFSDPRLQYDSQQLLDELRSVAQLVAVEVLEIRGARAIRSMMIGGSTTTSTTTTTGIATTTTPSATLQQ